MKRLFGGGVTDQLSLDGKGLAIWIID